MAALLGQEAMEVLTHLLLLLPMAELVETLATLVLQEVLAETAAQVLL
jgi:hypothetical protein